MATSEESSGICLCCLVTGSKKALYKIDPFIEKATFPEGAVNSTFMESNALAWYIFIGVICYKEIFYVGFHYFF